MEKEESKLAELANKLFNSKPDGTIIRTLENEVFLPINKN